MVTVGPLAQYPPNFEHCLRRVRFLAKIWLLCTTKRKNQLATSSFRGDQIQGGGAKT
jgi:hypothetical protein